MLHACVKRFVVTSIVRKILGTKRGLRTLGAARAGADDEQEQACLVAGSVHGSRASRAAALRLAGPPSGVLSNCLENLSVRTELGRAYRRRRRHALARRGTR